MRLIIDIPDGDYRYIKELQSLIIARGTCKTIQRDVINAIKNGTPYEERPKGKWIKRGYIGCDTQFYWCSVCEYERSYDAETGLDDYNFCPNCGADMRGDV